MTIITTDLKFYGKHGRIIRKLVENNIYSSNSDVFFDASLLGIYSGRKSETEASNSDEAQVSRTVFSKNPTIESILFTFLQMEKKFQQKPVETKEIFLYEDNNDDPKQLLEELIPYSLYGVELLGEKYSSVINSTTSNNPVDDLYKEEFLDTNYLMDKVQKDKKDFYKSYDDFIVKEEMSEISRIIDETSENE